MTEKKNAQSVVNLVFEEFLQALEKENVDRSIIDGLRIALVEKHELTPDALRRVLFVEPEIL